MKTHQRGFTLMELSIVLVIIGLVVGGIVFGKDLVHAAEMRALLSQKDKFTTAVNVFKEKYGALPGDMKPSKAAQFGFFTFTGSNAGLPTYGDGNRLIYGFLEFGCNAECGAFWRHLSDAKLIPTIGETLNADVDSGETGVPMGESVPINNNNAEALYMPKAKFGKSYWGAGALMYANHFGIGAATTPFKLKTNIFMLQLSDISAGYYTVPTISAVDAYSLDLKIDDGKPNTGKFLVGTYAIDAPVTSGGGRYWSDGTNDATGTPLSPNTAVCTIGSTDPYQADVTYNANPAKGGSNLSCMPVFVW